MIVVIEPGEPSCCAATHLARPSPPLPSPPPPLLLLLLRLRPLCCCLSDGAVLGLPQSVSLLIGATAVCQNSKFDAASPLPACDMEPVAPVAYQVILEPGIGQFREFEPRRVHTRINSLGRFLVHKLTCGKRESVS